MIEKIVGLLKELIENHLFPTLLSVVVTVLIYYLTPDNYDILVKLGKSLYMFFLFCLMFLIIETIHKIYRRVSIKKYYSRQEKESKRQNELEFEKQLFNITNTFSPEDMKIVYYFLRNGNKPLILNGAIYGDIVLDNYCIKNEFIVEKDDIVSLNPFSLEPDGKLEKGMYAERYILTDEWYDSFMHLMNKYGTITKFEIF